MNELPPFVEITMVAMDETVVNRLAGGAPGVSDVSSLFTTASSYDADLATLKNMLNAKKIPYRVFVTTVPLPGSKWSP